MRRRSTMSILLKDDKLLGRHGIHICEIRRIRLLFVSADLDKVFGNESHLFLISRRLDHLERHVRRINSFGGKLVDKRNIRLELFREELGDLFVLDGFGASHY